MSTVYLVPMNAHEEPELVERKLGTLWRAARLACHFPTTGFTALKLHVGEPGTRTFVPPVVAKTLVALLRASGATPFLTDTSVLYKSARDNGIGHAEVAQRHGFGIEHVGAPFIPADGLVGGDAEEIPVNGKHFEAVSIASAILRARALLVLSHATGHLGTGFGGALKNLGMGCASKKGKLRQHHGQQPRIDPALCQACGICVQWCPTDSIQVEEAAQITPETCIGCGECIAACPEDAVTFDWSVMGAQLQERIVEHAAGVLSGKEDNTVFFTAAFNMTKNCDCFGVIEQPVTPDIGVLASRDPVAIDQAVLDLVLERTGSRFESMTFPQHDATVGLRYAEQLGLGERQVQIEVVDVE